MTVGFVFLKKLIVLRWRYLVRIVSIGSALFWGRGWPGRFANFSFGVFQSLVLPCLDLSSYKVEPGISDGWPGCGERNYIGSTNVTFWGSCEVFLGLVYGKFGILPESPFYNRVTEVGSAFTV